MNHCHIILLNTAIISLKINTVMMQDAVGPSLSSQAPSPGWHKHFVKIFIFIPSMFDSYSDDFQVDKV